MQDIRNSDGRKVCQVDERRATVEIRRKDCIIISPINYRGHPDSLNITHRIQAGGESYPYICWSQRIATYENALAVAALWADVTALYVQGKGTFDEIACKLCR